MRKHRLIQMCLVLSHLTHAQNLIQNADFELYSSCPLAPSELPKANSWFISIISPDYFNCGFTGVLGQLNNSSAYSGTGFVGFLSMGDINGSGEAIGQILTQPLLANHTYSIAFAAKRTGQGTYATNCGGVEVYGFTANTPTTTNLIHASQFPNAILLGSTPTIQDTIWKLHTWNFSVANNINYLVFTISQAPSCTEYIFLDSISIIHLETTFSNELSMVSSSKIYPNPSTGFFTIAYFDDYPEITVSDIFGEVLVSDQNGQGTFDFFLENEGVYFAKIKTYRGILIRKLVVRH